MRVTSVLNINVLKEIQNTKYMLFCDLSHQEDKWHDSPLMCHSVKGQTQGFFKLMLVVLSWLMFCSVRAQCFCLHVFSLQRKHYIQAVTRLRVSTPSSLFCFVFNTLSAENIPKHSIMLWSNFIKAPHPNISRFSFAHLRFFLFL